MNSFQEKFRKYNKEQRLFEVTDRVLLSVSGGVDSSVLCRLMADTHSNWAIAHANFRLRGEESEEDEAFVRQLAVGYRVVFFVQSFSTSDFSQEQKISTQMAARQLRRAWFERLVKEEKFDYVALAHHHNDQLETMLLNLAKGSGIAGLRGMLPKSGIWIRPLLWATKEEMLSYASEQSLSWREDRTNAEDKYQRNWIRHRIIPALQKINPALLSTTQSAIERLREVEGVFQNEVKRIESEVVSKQDDKLFIHKNTLIEHPQAASLLAEWLSSYGFDWSDAQQIITTLRNNIQPGKQFFSDSYCLWIDREQLVVTTIDSFTDFSAEHDAGQTTKTPWGDLKGKPLGGKHYTIRTDANIAALAHSKLSFPLHIRPWQSGDAFQPLGMKHRKKVSDFLIDTKVPRYAKEKVLVLLSGNEIVWVVGHRIDHRYRLAQPGEAVYEITWQGR